MSNTETAETETPAKLETETCSRCGGGGQYSYCREHGTKCFKCGGSGRTYTKRGYAAHLYLESLRSKRLADVVVGDKFWMAGSPVNRAQWVIVEEVSTTIQRSRTGDGPWQDIEQIRLSGRGLKTKMPAGYQGGPESKLRIAQSAEGKASTLAAAVAYQGTLTKLGKPRKVKAD